MKGKKDNSEMMVNGVVMELQGMMEHREGMVKLEILVKPEDLVSKEQKDRVVLKELRDRRVLQAVMVQMVGAGRLETLDQKARKVLQVKEEIAEIEEQMERKVIGVQLVDLEVPVIVETKVQPVSRAKRVREEALVLMATKGTVERMEIPVLTEGMVREEELVQKEQKEIRDRLVALERSATGA